MNVIQLLSFHTLRYFEPRPLILDLSFETSNQSWGQIVIITSSLCNLYLRYSTGRQMWNVPYVTPYLYLKTSVKISNCSVCSPSIFSNEKFKRLTKSYISIFLLLLLKCFQNSWLQSGSRNAMGELIGANFFSLKNSLKLYNCAEISAFQFFLKYQMVIRLVSNSGLNRTLEY